MILKGEKIYLQEGLKEEDYPLILKGFTDLEVMKYISFGKEALNLKTAEEAKKIIEKLENGIIFGIYTNKNQFVGYSSLSDFVGKEECEFSIFILDKNYWGRGIGRESTRIVLDHAFKNLEMKKVILYTSEYNQNAIELYEKMGFKKTKLIPNDREIFLDGKWIPSGTVEMELLSK